MKLSSDKFTYIAGNKVLGGSKVIGSESSIGFALGNLPQHNYIRLALHLYIDTGYEKD